MKIIIFFNVFVAFPLLLHFRAVHVVNFSSSTILYAAFYLEFSSTYTRNSLISKMPPVLAATAAVSLAAHL